MEAYYKPNHILLAEAAHDIVVKLDEGMSIGKCIEEWNISVKQTSMSESEFNLSAENFKRKNRLRLQLRAHMIRLAIM